MVTCPECGTAVGETDEFCTSCGAALDGEQRGDQSAQDQLDERRVPEDQTGDRRSSRERAQRAQRSGERRGSAQHRQSREGRSRKGHDRERTTSFGGLSRRQVLAGTGIGVLAVGGGGAFFLLGGGGGGPKATTREYITALQKGNTERIASLVHPDSALDPDELAAIDVTVSIRSLSVESESDGRATVQATWTDDDGTSTFYLRKFEGDWKVYRQTQ